VAFYPHFGVTSTGMAGPLAALTAALDVAFPCRLAVDARLVIVACGHGLAGVQVGARADEVLRLVAPPGKITFEALRGLSGAEVELQARGGIALTAIVADDPDAGLVHVFARRQSEAASRERAGADLLRGLPHLHEGAFDEALRRIVAADAEALDIERVSFWRLAPEARAIHCEALLVRSTGEVLRGVELAATDYPAYFAALASGAVIAATDARRDPRTREFADGYLAPNGIGAMLDVPVFVGGELHGVLCHEHVGAAREFTVAEQQLAMAVAQAIAQALEVQSRRRAEEAARASEARFRKLVEISPVPLLVTRIADGRILYANEGIAELLREKRERILELRSVDFYKDPTERAAILDELRRVGHLREHELHLVRPDGTTFWGMLSAHPIEFDGQPSFLTGVVDLTEHKRAEEEIRRVLRALEERDAMFERDLERARAFQESMHPPRLVHPRVSVEVGFEPVDQVSGDTYDHEVDGPTLRLFLADATGHGVNAALTTMFLRSEYEVASRAHASPAEVLRELNVRMTRFHDRLTMRFTAVCMTLDLVSGELRWSAAAHPPPCVVRGGEVLELDTGGPFVGLTSDAEFPEWRYLLEPGEAICLYTDGISEALDASGRPLGERRLYDALAAAERAGEPLAAAALGAARAHAGKSQDDATILVARRLA
jgi:PAS domain S-box-containing protein